MNEKLNQEKKLNISFFFRKPKFPIICDIDGYVIAARSKSGIEKQLSKCDSFEKSRYDVIDVKGEGWSFHPEKMFITPLNMKKRWFKKEIIAMFNNRRNNFTCCVIIL